MVLYYFCLAGLNAVAPTVTHPESVVAEVRKRRWNALNDVLDINKKAKYRDRYLSTGYSYVSWEQVKDIF